MRAHLRFALAFVASCASAPPAATTPTPPASSSAAATDAGASPAPSASAEPEEPHRPRPPIDVTNLCHDVALLAYGEPPNFKTESLGRFMGDATGTAARERDGTLAVTLVDDKGNVLAKVSITRHMKKLEIGRSCRTLYAH